MAAAAGHGRLYADAYSVAPCGIYVAPDSAIRRPEDLAGVAISVGYQSGSHYSTIEALDAFLAPDEIKLSFADGLLFRRMERLFDREVPAVSLFSGSRSICKGCGEPRPRSTFTRTAIPITTRENFRRASST